MDKLLDTEIIPEEVSTPDLTITDLMATQAIIDLASSRGVFKPEEMEAVGTVYSKLAAFLEAIQASQADMQAEGAETL